MKKILVIVSIAFTSLLAFSLATFKVNAAVTWNTDYVFDALSTTHDGISLSIEADTNVFTLDGTTTGATDYSLPDMLSANTGGYALDPLKTYVVYYEYISGTMSGTQIFKPFEMTNSTYAAFRWIYLQTSSGTTQTATDYQQDKGIMISCSGTTPYIFRMRPSANAGNIFSNLKYKLTIKEVTPLTSEIPFFTDLTSTTIKGVSATFPDANTMVLSGNSTGGDVEVNLIDKINTAVKNPSNPVLIHVKNTSGTETDTTNGMIINANYMSTLPMISFDTGSNFGFAANEITNFYYAPNLGSATYTDYTLSFYVQELELYSSDEVTPPDTSEILNDIHVNVNGSNLVITDYFDVIAADNGYHLVSKTELDNTLVDGKYYVNIWNTLQSAQYPVIFTINAALMDQFYKVTVEQRYNGSSGINIQLDQEITSLKPVIEITDNSTSKIYKLYDNTELLFTSNELGYALGGVAASIFIEVIPTAEVKYYIDDVLFDSEYVIKNELIDNPVDVSAEKPGYVFIEWRDDQDARFDLNSDVVSSDILSLNAYFIDESTPTYTVTINSNGGTTVDPISVYENLTVMIPTISKSGYTFMGWYLDEALTTLFNPSTPITADITLYAKWTTSTSGGSIIDGETELSTTSLLIIGAVGLLVIAVGLNEYNNKRKKGSKRR